MEQISNELHPTPGQLWKNLRTGDVLFIYRKNGLIEGVFGDGKKKSDLEVMKIAKHSNGWTCIHQRNEGEGTGVEHPDSYEFRAS